LHRPRYRCPHPTVPRASAPRASASASGRTAPSAPRPSARPESASGCPSGTRPAGAGDASRGLQAGSARRRHSPRRDAADGGAVHDVMDAAGRSISGLPGHDRWSTRTASRCVYYLRPPFHSSSLGVGGFDDGLAHKRLSAFGASAVRSAKVVAAFRALSLKRDPASATAAHGCSHYFPHPGRNIHHG
jgi:hypothetical protein